MKYKLQVIISRNFILVTGYWLLVTGYCFSQSSYLPLERSVTAEYERLTSGQDIGFHSSVKPFLRSDLKQWVNVDSIENSVDVLEKINKKFSKKDSLQNTGYKKQDARYIELSPLFFLNTGYEISDTVKRSVAGTAIGASLNAELGEKFYLNANYLAANFAQPTFVNQYIDSNKIIPGEGYSHPTKIGYHYKNFSGSVSYSPWKYFNFQLGHGKNFIGDGYRSLLLSDVANNYSYFKITTTVWKVKYVNIFANFKDVRGDYTDYWHFKNKYGTFHYLSWNLTRWLNIGLFESVIWQGKDTLNNRGFDVNYLNPVIFYRPVEYSVGSPDNEVTGLNLKIKITHKIQFYSQIVLDEFLLKEVKAWKNGWWGNKQGGQAGLKYFDAFGVNGLSFQTEFNMVRPYTYSHGSVLQNYGHFNQPLAHPLGANFYEGLGIIRYQKKRFSIEEKFTAAVIGTDPKGKNFGGDIYKSYDVIPNIYGNFTTQGIRNYLAVNELKANYMIYPKLNLKLEAGVLFRAKYALKNFDTNVFFWLGLRTSLYNVYRDFM